MTPNDRAIERNSGGRRREAAHTWKEEVILAIAEERAAWDRMVNSIPRKNERLLGLNEVRRDAANLALLLLLSRVSQIAEEET